MPVDSSIYGMIQPPQVMDPLAQAGKAFTLQGMIGQNDLHQLQTGKLRKDLATEEAVSNAIKGSSGDPAAIEAAYLRAGDAKGLQAWKKSQLETQEKQANLLKTNLEMSLKKAEALHDDIATLGPASDMAAFAERSKALYGPDVVNRVQIPQTFSPEWQATATRKGKDLQTNIQNELARKTTERGQDMTANTALAGQAVTVRGQDLTDARTRSEGAANRGVTLRGQDLTDSRARDTAAGGKVPAGYRFKADGTTLEAIPGGPADGLTSTQKDDLTSIAQTRSAAARLKDMFKPEFVGFKGTAGEMMDRYGSQVIPGVDGDQARIQFRALAADTENQYIKSISGATVPTSEVPRLRRAIPTPSDSPAQYKAKLELMEKNLEQLPNIIRTASKPTGASPAPTTPSQESKTIGGKTYVKVDGKWFEQ